MTPFEAVYGNPPPSIQQYIPGSSKVQAMEKPLRSRDALLLSLKEHMLSLDVLVRISIFKTNQYTTKTAVAMSSLSDSQECSFPDERKKLDGFRLFDTGNPQRTKDSETNSMFNIRKSLAWDSAFFTSPGVLEPEELLQCMNSQLTGNAINLLGRKEGILLPSESLEPAGMRKLESCSFRKSLAWDSARGIGS